MVSPSAIRMRIVALLEEDALVASAKLVLLETVSGVELTEIWTDGLIST